MIPAINRPSIIERIFNRIVYTIWALFMVACISDVLVFKLATTFSVFVLLVNLASGAIWCVIPKR